MQNYKRIFIRDLQLKMHIGVGAEERAELQKVVLNLEADVFWLEDLQDDYSKVVCYASLYEWIIEAAKQPLALLESFAQKIADYALEKPQIMAVRVRVEKPDILPGAVVGVDICQKR